MTADEIRNGADTFRSSMKQHARSGEGEERYIARAAGAQVEVLMEIAAQLAELNEKLPEATIERAFCHRCNHYHSEGEDD